MTEDKKILIVKCSSLGDIIQSFIVIDYLLTQWPHALIDWVVEKSYEPLIASHPKIHRAIGVEIKLLFSLPFRKQISYLRTTYYDYVFDLQGNCKSAIVTFLAKAKEKVGFGSKSVREWPNMLITRKHYNVDGNQKMPLQYLALFQEFFNDHSLFSWKGVVLHHRDLREKDYCAKLLTQSSGFRILVSPSSRWENKKLSLAHWQAFLSMIEKEITPFFFFVWGNDQEKKEAEKLHSFFPKSHLVDKLSLPGLQLLMTHMDLHLAVDSCLLHLGTTLPHLATFSFFGPTRQEIFQPLGPLHASFQGKCLYGKTFSKSCSFLRTCKRGECLKNLPEEELQRAFYHWKAFYLENFKKPCS